MMAKKTVTKMALLIFAFQYDIVIDAAMISNGKTINHCRA